MNLCDRIVTKIPLEILWTSENELESQRIDYLTPTIIRDLLKQGEVYFIVADVGQKLLWIQPAECYITLSQVVINLAQCLNHTS